MFTNSKLAKSIRLAMAVGAAASISFSSNLYAQEAEEGASADEKSIEKISVTGSRIKRIGFDSAQPIAVIDSEQLQSLGYTNISDALNNLPSFGVPGNSSQGDQGEQGVGQNFVNFYGLGSQRTLTLVNGRRFVSSNPLSGGGAADGLQVDLNMIPIAMVERVETVSVGGAPIYGSDAIAGTVNIILKDDFEGVSFSASSGISDRDDLEENKFSLVAGGNFDDDRGNAVFSIEYSTKKGLVENQRDHLAKGYQFREPCSGDTPVENGAGESAFTQADCAFDRILSPGGHANLVGSGGLVTTFPFALPNLGLGALGDGNFHQFQPDGTLGSYNIGLPTDNAVWSIGGEGIFLPDVTNLYAPVDRLLVNSIFNYEITENVNVFGEFFFGNTKATELANQPFYQSGLFGEESGALSFSVDNPFISDTARAQLGDLGVTETFFLQRASVDLLPANNGVDNEGHLWRAVAGFNGAFELAAREFNWEVYYNIGKSDSVSQRATIFTDRFFYALDAVQTADGIQCRVVADPTSRPDDPAAVFGASSATDAFDNCQPLNLFGAGAPSQESLNYMTGTVTAKSEIQQEVVGASVSTSLFELPGGWVDIAVGAFRRTETANFTPDAAYQGNLTRSGVLTPISGSFTVDEYYAEFFAPLVSEDMDVPFIHHATIEGAYRVMDNSFAGQDEAWTLGLNFAPVEDVELRANVTRSVRAPSITELFQPVVEIGAFATDPCDSGNNTSDTAKQANRERNCASDGIDRSTFISQAGNASVQGTSGGNTGLENEVADSFTVGVILSPRWVEGLTVAIDYVEIELEDSIESFSLSNIMAACYDADDFPNDFCGKFRRDPVTKQLPSTDAFESGFVNAGIRKFRGTTIDALYSTGMDTFGLEGAGDISFGAYVFLPQENVVTPIDTPNDNHNEPGNADLQASFTVNWHLDKLNVTLQPRYIGESVINNNDVREATDTLKVSRNILDIEEQWLVDMGVSYQVFENTVVRFNVNNVFDELPSSAAIASGNDGVYNNIGRYFRFGFNVNF